MTGTFFKGVLVLIECIARGGTEDLTPQTDTENLGQSVYVCVWTVYKRDRDIAKRQWAAAKQVVRCRGKGRDKINRFKME